jgi:hypothetical protein
MQFGGDGNQTAEGAVRITGSVETEAQRNVLEYLLR